MNGFMDLHATFGGNGAPKQRRLENRWVPVAADLDSLWLGTATAGADAVIQTASAPGWQVWAAGDVFTYRSAAVEPLGRFADDLASGTADPSRLDAHAVVFGWEAAPRRLHVWIDRMGTVHAYLGGAPGRLSVGTCLAAVAEGSRQDLDWVAITGFCGFGFYPADRTMFQDVRILRPATWTVLDDRGVVLSERRYWDWWFDPSTHRTDDDLVDEFHDIWTRTVNRQIAGRDVVVPISGGLDSRTVLAAAAPIGGNGEGPRVGAFTYGYTPTSPEIRISQRVAGARGLHAEEFVVEPYLLDRIDEVMAAVEGFQSLSFSRQVGISGPLTAMGQRVVGGHMGDVWFDAAVGSGANGPDRDLVDVAYRKFTKPGGTWLLDNLCASNLHGSEPEHLLRDLLSDELARLTDLSDPDITLKALKTDQWSFRWTLASVRAYQLGIPTLLPFYADEVIDFFLRIPPEQLRGRRLQTAYLRRHHPDLARITWQDSDMSLFERAWEPTAALGRRVARKAMRTTSQRPVIQRNWEVQYLGAQASERVATKLLARNSDLAALMDEKSLRYITDEFHHHPNAATGYAIDALMTIASVLADRS